MSGSKEKNLYILRAHIVYYIHYLRSIHKSIQLKPSFTLCLPNYCITYANLTHAECR